jgi:hypothetical protein
VRASRASVRIVGLALVAGAATGVSSGAVEAAASQQELAGTTTGTLVLSEAARTMPRSWPRSFTIPYGDAAEELGREWYDDGMERLYPASGAKAPDGTWWILDTVNLRFARYSSSGRYLGEVPLPPRTDLQPGLESRFHELPYRGPRVLADGTVVAVAAGRGTTSILRVREGTPDILTVPGQLGIRADDGQRLYGHDWSRPVGTGHQAVAVDPRTGAVSDVTWFRKQDGTRYRVSVSNGTRLRVQLPDATPPVDRSWTLSGAGGRPVDADLAEIASGADGTLHLLFGGTIGGQIGLDPGSRVLSGYVPVAANGTAGAVEASLLYHPPAPPGVGPLIGVAYGSTVPWALWLFGGDALTVWERAVPIVRGLELACPAGTVPAHGFDDVAAGDTHASAIACARWRELTRGTTPTTYSPTRAVTRAQAASFLLQLIRRTEVDLATVEPRRFPDTTGNVHEPAISLLAGAGVIVGRDGRFDPNAPISRAQLATLLVRTHDLLVFEVSSPLPADPADHFTDDAGSAHEPAIDRAAAAGLVAGVGPYRYRPTGSATRAQFASVLVRSLDLLTEGGAIAPPQPIATAAP